MSWYSDLASRDVNEAARALAGNWRRFECFAWGGTPAHRPEDCAIIYLEHRGSGCLDQSNAAVIYRVLAPATGDLDDGAMVETQSHNHWAVGHVDGIVIRCVDADGQATWAFHKLYELACKLDTYPILDEADHTEREEEEAARVWRECYTPKERIEYIRRAGMYEFGEFRSLADLMGSVRGRYFGGYASELLAR